VTEEARKGLAGLIVINCNYLVATSLLSAVYGTYDDLSAVRFYIHDMCRHLYHDPSAAAYVGRGLILWSAHLSGYGRKSPPDPPIYPSIQGVYLVVFVPVVSITIFFLIMKFDFGKFLLWRVENRNSYFS